MFTFDIFQKFITTRSDATSATIVSSTVTAELDEHFVHMSLVHKLVLDSFEPM